MAVRIDRYVAAITALGLGAVAMAAETSTEDLKAQIDVLQKKVEALEAKQVSAADVDATVRAVLEDSQRRSQFMAVEGFTAGYTADRGFVLQSADGAFLIHPYVQFQFREASNYRDAANADGDSDTNNGFEVRRLKFGVEGNVYSKAITYQFQWATQYGSATSTNPGEGTPTLEDAWVKYRFQDAWAVQAGQFKDPLFRESLVSSTKQLAADRSIQNSILEGNDNYIEGVSLLYGDKDRLHGQVAFTDGFAGNNSSAADPTGGDPTDSGYKANNKKNYNFGLAGRLDYMVLGDPDKSWKRYSGFSAQGKDQSDLLILGAAGEWDQVGDYNSYWYTADAQWMPEAVAGLSVYGALVGRYVRVDNTTGSDNDGSDWGALVQAGYMVTSRVEPFVRYDFTRVGNTGTISQSTLDSFDNRTVQEITAGVNYYFFGHNAKATLDLTYLPNGSPSNFGGLDIYSQTQDKEQWLARVQFQLVL